MQHSEASLRTHCLDGCTLIDDTFKASNDTAFYLGHTKLMLCFTVYLPSQGDLVGQEKMKIKVYCETICITKITMIANIFKIQHQFTAS